VLGNKLQLLLCFRMSRTNANPRMEGCTTLDPPIDRQICATGKTLMAGPGFWYE
jgi:hypothetical protein